MLHIIHTLDYEIHGNGQGSPTRLMVRPTARLLRQFARHGARLTIMADAAEILRFRDHLAGTGRDDFGYGAIVEQLQLALADGHDVQLHLHPSYFNARLVDGAWAQDYAEYDIAALSAQRLVAIVAAGKQWLEELLRPIDPSYRCVAFRAANWSMYPSAGITRALISNGIKIDTSVFKYGRRDGIVHFDYRHAHDPVRPWRVDPDDVCRQRTGGELLEFPICCEQRRLHHFVNPNRIYRSLQDRLHPVPGEDPLATVESNGAPRAKWQRAFSLLRTRHAWKLDFNQCSGRQLVAALERAAQRYDRSGHVALPVVLIGHSKLLNNLNARSVEPFLDHVASHPDRFRFNTFPGALETIEARRA